MAAKQRLHYFVFQHLLQLSEPIRRVKSKRFSVKNLYLFKNLTITSYFLSTAGSQNKNKTDILFRTFLESLFFCFLMSFPSAFFFFLHENRTRLQNLMIIELFLKQALSSLFFFCVSCQLLSLCILVPLAPPLNHPKPRHYPQM